MAACLLTAGCPNLPYHDTDVLKRNEELQRENRHLGEQLDEANRQIAELSRQVRWGYQMTPGQRAELITVAGINLGRFTGGTDLDGRIGDDGIKVYVQPADADGDVLLAAGTLDVQLFDLDLDRPDRRIGHWTLTPPQLRKEWSASFVGSWFSPTFPWQGAPPAHEHLTVRVQFTDLLTGRSFVKQADFDVHLPPATSRPAAGSEKVSDTGPASRPQVSP